LRAAAEQAVRDQSGLAPPAPPPTPAAPEKKAGDALEEGTKEKVPGDEDAADGDAGKKDTKTKDLTSEEAREAAAAMERAIADADRGFVGINIAPVALLSPKEKTRWKIAATKGVVIFGVVPEAPAAKAGLKDGDVLVRFNGHDVAATPEVDPQDKASRQKWGDTLASWVRGVKVGADLPLVVERDGKPVTIVAKTIDFATLGKLRKAAGMDDDEDDDEGDDEDDDEDGDEDGDEEDDD
jgi:hypothetical protein